MNIAHLGNDASVSAVHHGICVDTSMGFTPLEGIMMGTRSGSLDPGILVYLLREKGLDAEQLDHALNAASGGPRGQKDNVPSSSRSPSNP